MNVMTYKGYTAVLEIDQEDGILFGKVIGLRDGITFEAETVPQATEEFHRSVDFYLEVCASRGEDPEKPYSGNFMVRIGSGLAPPARELCAPSGAPASTRWSRRPSSSSSRDRPIARPRLSTVGMSRPKSPMVGAKGNRRGGAGPRGRARPRADRQGHQSVM